MNSYTVAIVVVAFTPAMVCIGAAIGLTLNERDTSPAGAGFGWAGFILGGGAMLLVDHIIARASP